MDQRQGQEDPEADRPEYGRRLSRQEYDLRAISLHEAQAPIPARADREKLRRAELDLAVDHTLGVGFPQDQREVLWRTQQKLDRSNLVRLIIGLLANPLAPSRYLVKAQVREFSKVLDRRSVCAFLGLSEKDYEKLI